MGMGSRYENSRTTRTRSNVRTYALTAAVILLCVGITRCDSPSSEFALFSPENGATSVWLTPTLTWIDGIGETTYAVEIDDENTFSPPLVHQNTGIPAGTTSFIVPSGVLDVGTTYYWRIVAINSAGSTIASNAPFSFTVLSSGALAPGFGTSGAVTSNPSMGDDYAYGIAVDSTAMYVVGSDYSPGEGDCQWRIEKRSLTDASLVTGFGIGGVVASDPSAGDDVAWDIAVDSTALYLVGCDDSPGNSRWRIEKRNLTDGNLVPGFGTGGVVTINSSTGDDCARRIAIDSSAMYVVGFDYSQGNQQWRIEKRSLTDASLVTGFGIGGVVASDPSTGDDAAWDIAIDSTAIYVVGYDDSPGNSQWRIEKRNLTDGSLVPGFGTGGVVTINPSTGDDYAYGITIDATAMYVVGFDYSPGLGNRQWRIENRSLTDGSSVLGFGIGGVTTSNPSTGYDTAWDIALDSTAIYVVGYDQSLGDYQWRIEKRSKTDGSLVTGFGTGGIVTSNPSTGAESAYGVAIDSTATYVVGYDRSHGDRQWLIEKRVK